jgi:hypothetical protein
VDHSALRVNQALIISLLALAFVLNVPWLVVAVALIMGLGTLRGQPGFRWVYTGLLKPRGWVRPDLLQDNPEPHIFAQGFGAAVVWAGAIALLAGVQTAGWALVGLVIALAALNLFARFCAGCAVYYWLGRLRVPGFSKAPPADTFPGLRPPG